MPFIDDDEYESLQGGQPFLKKERDLRDLDTLSGIDQKLINYAGVLTPVQIAEILGIDPQDVAKRTLEVLNSIDIFTVEQMRAKQMIMLNQLIAEALNRLPTASEKAAPALMNATGGNIQRAIKELGEIEARAQENHSKLENAYARRMADIVARSFDRYLGRLGVLYPEIDPTELATGFQETILQIAREIDEEA